jgi:hypothetical protein
MDQMRTRVGNLSEHLLKTVQALRPRDRREEKALVADGWCLHVDGKVGEVGQDKHMQGCQ